MAISNNIWNLWVSHLYSFFIIDHSLYYQNPMPFSSVGRNLCTCKTGLSLRHFAFPGVHSSRHEDFADCREVPAVAADLRSVGGWLELGSQKFRDFTPPKSNMVPGKRRFLLETIIIFRVHEFWSRNFLRTKKQQIVAGNQLQ